MKLEKGFSMIELLIVVGIAAGIFLLSAPFSLRFYHTQVIDDVQLNIMNALQRARHNAVLQKNDSNFGVFFDDTAHNYILYQGDAQGDDTTYDEVYSVNTDITIATGLTDVNFAKLTGVPSATGTIEIVRDNLTRSILIGDVGSISATSTVAGGDPEESCDASCVAALQTSLVGYWPLNDDVNDYSGNSRNAAWTGSSQYAAGAVLSQNGAVLDGTNDYIETTYTSNTLQNFSTSLWVKPSSSQNSNANMIAQNNTNGGAYGTNGGWDIIFRGSNTWSFAWQPSCTGTTGTSNFTLTPNVWTHIATIKSGTSIKVYLNGTLTKNETGSSANVCYEAAFPFTFGAWWYNHTRRFTGSLQEIAIWDRVLDGDDVANLYNAGTGLSLE